MIGLCSKGTDGQMYTSSSKEEYILLNVYKLFNWYKWQILKGKTQAKVCMTLERKTSYCSVI